MSVPYLVNMTFQNWKNNEYEKYIAMAAMAAMMSENMVYMNAPYGGKTAKSWTKQQKRRRSVSQKNRKANRKNRH